MLKELIILLIDKDVIKYKTVLCILDDAFLEECEIVKSSQPTSRVLSQTSSDTILRIPDLENIRKFHSKFVYKIFYF